MIELPGSGLRIERRFELNLNSLLAEDNFGAMVAAQYVLEEILPVEVPVFAVGERIAVELNDDKDPLLIPEGSGSVILREWLPLSCQCIRWHRPWLDDPKEKDATMGYERNIVGVLLGGRYEPNEYTPQGPAAFEGSIVIHPDLGGFTQPLTAKLSEVPEVREWRRGERPEIPLNAQVRELLASDQKVDRFCYMLAHEIVHASRYLSVLVPAFLDWEAFRRSFLERDNVEEAFKLVMGLLNSLVDQYGTDAERNEIARLWPDDLVNRWWEVVE